MSAYAAPLLLLVLAVVVLGAVYTVALLAAPSRRPVRVEPYLSGLAPNEYALSRFHVRWYAVTLLFLAFDMEMVFMYPWTLVVAEVGITAVVEMFLFLFLLMVGVAYGWREGALRWS